MWTTGGQFSDFAILLTCTNPDGPTHRGMTMFGRDMRTPGVEVRPQCLPAERRADMTAAFRVQSESKDA